jgi:hypothetical protein
MNIIKDQAMLNEIQIQIVQLFDVTERAYYFEQLNATQYHMLKIMIDEFSESTISYINDVKDFNRGITK